MSREGSPVAGWLGVTANLGGQIRHPEIRGDALFTTTAGAAGEDEEERGRDRDRR
jgi:hypothetical protein